MLLRKTEVAATYEPKQFRYTYTQQILVLHYTEKKKVDIVQKRRREKGKPTNSCVRKELKRRGYWTKCAHVGRYLDVPKNA